MPVVMRDGVEVRVAGVAAVEVGDAVLRQVRDRAILFLCASSIAAVMISGVSSPRLKNLMPSMLFAGRPAHPVHAPSRRGHRAVAPTHARVW